MKRFSLVLVAIATMLFSTVAFATDDGNFGIGLATGLPATDTTFNLSNSGSSWGQSFPGITGAIVTTPTSPIPVPITGPLFPIVAPQVFIGNGNLCANVYVFSADEQEQACCSCPMTPNSLHSYLASELTSNTLTGVHPGAIIVKIVTSEQDPTKPGVCDPTNVNKLVGTAQVGQPLASGLVAWGRRATDADVPLVSASLSKPELERAVGLCKNIKDNGSGHGICPPCFPDGR